jgi:hypothetical protein
VLNFTVTSPQQGTDQRDVLQFTNYKNNPSSGSVTVTGATGPSSGDWVIFKQNSRTTFGFDGPGACNLLFFSGTWKSKKVVYSGSMQVQDDSTACGTGYFSMKERGASS